MRTLVQISLPLFAFANFVHADPPQRLEEPVLDSLLAVGMDQTLKQEYETAFEAFKRMTREAPDHPAGYLFQAAVLQASAMDYEETPDESQFDSLLALSKDRARRMIEHDPESALGYFFFGTMLGYDSYARAQRGDWFGAVTRGMSATSNLQKVVSLDSTFYDAYAGIGTYAYWKSRKMEFLTWLPFVSDDRHEGMALLERCYERGTYNRFAAASALVTVALDAGDNEKAILIAKSALQSYPTNRIFLWGLATALERAEKSLEAIAAYEQLLSSILNDTRENLYNELVARLNLVRLKERENRMDGIPLHLRRIHSMLPRQFPQHLRARAVRKLEEANEFERLLSASKPGGK